MQKKLPDLDKYQSIVAGSIPPPSGAPSLTFTFTKRKAFAAESKKLWSQSLFVFSDFRQLY